MFFKSMGCLFMSMSLVAQFNRGQGSRSTRSVEGALLHELSTGDRVHYVCLLLLGHHPTSRERGEVDLSQNEGMFEQEAQGTLMSPIT